MAIHFGLSEVNRHTSGRVGDVAARRAIASGSAASAGRTIATVTFGRAKPMVALSSHFRPQVRHAHRFFPTGQITSEHWRRTPATRVSGRYDRGGMALPFVFMMRAYAAAHFELQEHIEISWPDSKAFLQSEYTGGGSGRAYPVTLYGQIFGEASSLEAAQFHLSASIGNTLPVVALAGERRHRQPTCRRHLRA
jgi:hypothetical protein